MTKLNIKFLAILSYHIPFPFGIPFEAKKHILLTKNCVCTFGKIKKLRMKQWFGLKNHDLTIDLKGPFPKDAFSQKSWFANVLPNSTSIGAPSPFDNRNPSWATKDPWSNKDLNHPPH